MTDHPETGDPVRDALVLALTATGNSVKTYTVIDWCADRLEHVLRGDLMRLGGTKAQQDVIDWLRKKGQMARSALAQPAPTTVGEDERAKLIKAGYAVDALLAAVRPKDAGNAREDAEGFRVRAEQSNPPDSPLGVRPKDAGAGPQPVAGDWLLLDRALVDDVFEFLGGVDDAVELRARLLRHMQGVGSPALPEARSAAGNPVHEGDGQREGMDPPINWTPELVSDIRRLARSLGRDLPHDDALDGPEASPPSSLTAEQIAAIQRKNPVSQEAMAWAETQAPAVDAIRRSGVDPMTFATLAEMRARVSPPKDKP